MFFENLTTELKREYVDDIKKTVIAFANTGGGKIFIGVDDAGTPVGVGNGDETILRVTNAVRDAILPDVTLFTSYNIEKIGEASIVIVDVQKGASCPYYLKNKGIRPEGVYVRQGASTVPAASAAILKMIKDTDGETYEEMRSLNQDITFSDAEKEFRDGALELGAAQMRTLHLIKADGIYSNLALLLSDQCIHTIKLAVFEGSKKTIFKDRQEFTGSLFKQMREAFAFIDRYNRTRSEFQGLKRIDMRDYPGEAIREVLLNAIVHREYSFHGSTLISIFDDRMEFVTLGGLAKGISRDDILLGISIPRNKYLADIFYRLHLIEAFGTGIPKITESYAGYETGPKIEITENAFKLTLPNTNFEADIKCRETFLTEGEQAVIDIFQAKDIIVRKDVENALAVSQPMAIRLLKQLADKRMIKRLGSGKNTRYTL